MKKLLFVIIIIVIAILGYFFVIKNEKKQEEKFIYEDILNNTISDIDVSRFTIYGKHLNLEGNVLNDDNYEVVLKNNDKELLYPTAITSQNDNMIFEISSYINDGINLEKLEIGEYILLLKKSTDNTYYRLINKTEYKDNEYYTITKNGKNNLITFHENTFEDKKYWTIKVEEVKLPENVYDIVIDPGHGGVDTGASNGKYYESKFTLDYAKTLKQALEEEGLKVKLTRENDTKIDYYGVNSRTGIPYEVKAKLMLSIHLNSSNSASQKGVEIYKAYNDNNDFAKILADNIVKEVNTTYSNNPQNKVIDGVYMRVYSKKERDNLKTDGQKGNFTPYVIDENTTYYYFIRETGGIMTKAFSDGRNPKYKENIYRNYNQGVEAYLCELSYISQKNDLLNVINKKDDFTRALKESVISYLD